MVYTIAKKTILAFARLFLKEVEGIENIPRKGPFIITSNHESYLDPFLIGSIIIPLLNKKIHFLAKKGRFWNLFGDTISRKWAGCICADEGNEKALKKLSLLLKKDKIVGIFIEGERSFDGQLKKGKTGVVRLALTTKVPILPIGIIGTFDIAPGNKLIPRIKRAKMNIGKLIYLDNYYERNKDSKLLRKLTDDIMHVISDLTRRPYNC